MSLKLTFKILEYKNMHMSVIQLNVIPADLKINSMNTFIFLC